MCPEPPWPVVLEVMSKATRRRCLEKETIIFHLKIQTLKITMPFSSLYPAFPIWGRTKTCQDKGGHFIYSLEDSGATGQSPLAFTILLDSPSYLLA